MLLSTLILKVVVAVEQAFWNLRFKTVQIFACRIAPWPLIQSLMQLCLQVSPSQCIRSECWYDLHLDHGDKDSDALTELARHPASRDSTSPSVLGTYDFFGHGDVDPALQAASFERRLRGTTSKGCYSFRCATRGSFN